MAGISTLPNFFSLTIFLFKGAGTWIPNHTNNTKIKLVYYFYNLFWFLICSILFMSLEFGSMPYTYQNYSDFIKNVSLTITHVLTLLKVIFWYIFRKKFIKLLKQLDEKLYDYNETENYNPKKIVEEEKDLIDGASKIFLGVAMSVSISSGVVCYSTLFLHPEEHYYEKIDDNVTLTYYEQALPYYSLMPFNHTKNRFTFGLAIFYQVICVMNYAWLIVGFDSFFATIMTYLCAHLKVLQGAFRTIKERCIQKINLDEDLKFFNDPIILQKEMEKESGKCIKHLQLIIDTQTELENTFSPIVFIQMMVSLAVFCTNLYLVSSSKSSDDMGAEIFYMLAIQNQLALYCFFGSRITISAEDIPNHIYEGDWFSANNSFKKNMLITMIRMSKPLYFTIGKFTPITLQTYVTISRASYSFVAVLKNGIQDEKNNLGYQN